MSKKITVQHTNSASLKEQKLLRKERDSRICGPYSRPYILTILSVITCCIFLIYWFILTPLLINKTITLYWFIAFLIWLFIMLCLTLIYWKTKIYDDVTLQSYGTNTSQVSKSLINTKFDGSHNAKLTNTKRNAPSNEIADDKPNTVAFDETERNKVRKHKELPPLVIHRRNSGKIIENIGTVNSKENVDEDGENQKVLKSGDDNQEIQRESMKDYLKLVTVTPQDELDTRSLKGPLSPRDLFFIDLIKEAEKAEQKRASNPEETKKNHFFPSNFSPIEKDEEEEKKLVESVTINTEENATYFIANVENPKSEKTEVFLTIDPSLEPIKELFIDLANEKPVPVLNSSTNKENENI